MNHVILLLPNTLRLTVEKHLRANSTMPKTKSRAARQRRTRKLQDAQDARWSRTSGTVAVARVKRETMRHCFITNITIASMGGVSNERDYHACIQ